MRASPLVIGTVIGGIVVGFVEGWILKTRFLCQFDGIIWWTALGAVGTTFAAGAAVYASRQATAIASSQIEYQRSIAVSRAKVVAAFIRGELESAGRQMDGIVVVHDAVKKSELPLESIAALISTMGVVDIALSLEHVRDLEEMRDGDLVANAVTRIGDVRSALKALNQMNELAAHLRDEGKLKRAAFDHFFASAQTASLAITKALNILPQNEY